MGERARQIFQHLKQIDGGGEVNWVTMEGGNDSISIESSLEDSTNSISSSSTSDLIEDASSSHGSSNSSSLNGPLYQLSDLMAQLPIKRGLSKNYEGKSQSFASLASVKSIEDLAKKGYCYRMKMKTCKSYGGGLDGHKLYSPKPTISKKASRKSLFSTLPAR